MLIVYYSNGKPNFIALDHYPSKCAVHRRRRQWVHALPEEPPRCRLPRRALLHHYHLHCLHLEVRRVFAVNRRVRRQCGACRDLQLPQLHHQLLLLVLPHLL